MEINSRPGWKSMTIKYMRNGWYPLSWLKNRFLATFRTTTQEEKDRIEDPCYERYVILSFILPFYVFCIVLYAPIAAICFLVWISLQSGQPGHKLINLSVPSEATLKWDKERPFQIASINTYLLPEYSARYYNLGQTQSRAQKIVATITEQGNCGGGVDNVALEYDSDSEYDYSIDQDTPMKKHQQDTFQRISTQFPKDLDVVCLQGVFESRAQERVVLGLSEKFPHIVSDCEVNSWSTNRFRWPSGLVVASRWPIEDACFKPFSTSCAWDKNVCKGVLIAKVQLNSASEKNSAYIVNVHTQEGYGQDAVATRDKQLNELKEIMEGHCKERKPGTSVLFSVICGQLGFDNISSGVRSNWSHDLLSSYFDACRKAPGRDNYWSIGTQLIQHKIHKDSVSTPENLKKCLEAKQEHTNYLESCQIVTEEEDDTSRRGRKRVNYILVKPQYPIDEETQPQVIKQLTYITALAGLTLQIPTVVSLDASVL